MRKRTLRRFALCDGFTLVELLAVAMVIGLLAALAIPSFLQAAGDAGDAPAKSQASAAQLAVEGLALENDGSYAGTSRSALHRYEPSIETSRTGADAYLSAANGGLATYAITVTSMLTGDKFTITRNADGTVRRTCKLPSRQAPHNGCTTTRGANGTW